MTHLFLTPRFPDCGKIAMRGGGLIPASVSLPSKTLFCPYSQKRQFWPASKRRLTLESGFCLFSAVLRVDYAEPRDENPKLQETRGDPILP